MKDLRFVLVVFLLFNLSACDTEDKNVGEENLEKNGTLIFGWFGDASCSGQCSSIYKLENGKLYKDFDFNYPENTFFEGNFQLVPNADYQNFRPLLVELPNEIYNEPNGYLNCNDCTNTNGGFYLEFQGDDGFHRSWRIRNALYPDYMENYRSLLLDKLAELNSL